MTLFDAMLFFLLSLVTLNLLSNPIQVTFIKYLSYSPEVHLKLWWTLSMHADSFPPPDLSLSVMMPVEELSCSTSVGLTRPVPGTAWKSWGFTTPRSKPQTMRDTVGR